MRLPIETHVYDIPQRLREIDPALRVCFNTDTQKFEVWGRDLCGPYILAVFDSLDCRAVDAVRKGYFLASSTGQPYKAVMQEHESALALAENARMQRLKDIEYGIRNDLRFIGKMVVPGAAF